jgi:hypothetical protein
MKDENKKVGKGTDIIKIMRKQVLLRGYLIIHLVKYMLYSRMHNFHPKEREKREKLLNQYKRK